MTYNLKTCFDTTVDIIYVSERLVHSTGWWSSILLTIFNLISNLIGNNSNLFYPFQLNNGVYLRKKSFYYCTRFLIYLLISELYTKRLHRNAAVYVCAESHITSTKLTGGALSSALLNRKYMLHRLLACECVHAHCSWTHFVSLFLGTDKQILKWEIWALFPSVNKHELFCKLRKYGKHLKRGRSILYYTI